MKWSKNNQERQIQVQEAFKKLGFEFPSNEKELLEFEEMFKDYPYQIDPSYIEPEAILQEISYEKKMLTWIKYNKGFDPRESIRSIEINFKRAISGNEEYCNCTGKGEFVNDLFIKWHCSYCLKPKKNRK